MRIPGSKLGLLFLASMATLGLLALIWAMTTGSSEAQQGAMQNCPQAGKWAISVWSGDDGTDADQAFATCNEGGVAAAYYIDPDKQAWSRYFMGQAEISTLSKLDNTQGLIALGAGGARSPTLTPTPISTLSERIAFVSDRDGNDEIYVMNAGGAALTRLTKDPEQDMSPTWSPDGSKITFDSYRDGDYEIYVMNADGTDQTNLTNNPAWDMSPAWSP